MRQTFKERCIALRKQDKSIGEIMKITGRPKSSIYAHIRDIPLSSERLRAARLRSNARIREYSLARKGKSARPFREFGAWTPGMVSLVAHLLFDGEMKHGGCVYNNRSQALLDHVEEHMKELYDFEPNRYTNPSTGVRRISYYNVTLRAYLQRRAAELLRTIGGSAPRLKEEFLRAFFDDEGCIDFRPAENRRSIRGYQKNVRILHLVRRLLRNMGIESRIVLPNEVVISRKENLVLFEKLIGFSPGIYMNSERANSRWKKHIEKRELLHRAIASFKA